MCPLSKISDLWAYFIIKSVNVLKTGGNIAAILPWAFLQADFSIKLRAWIADRFSNIEVLAVSSQLFKHAEERIALVWLIDKGRSAQSIKIQNASDLKQKGPKINLSWNEWLRPRIIATGKGSIDELLSSLLKNGFIPLRNVAEIKIGTVTGADSFFIANKLFAQELGLEIKDYIKIIKTLKNIKGFHLNGNCPDQVLMYFSEKPQNLNLLSYIELGENQGLHLRAHSLRRNVWFVLPRNVAPDAFFPYRCSHTPYIIINRSKCLCTNSVHAINWKSLNINQIKWIQVSLLSVFGQLFLEAYAKIYGSGVLKIEPGTLKNALVMKSIDVIPGKIYNRINALLQKNERKIASELATNVVQKYCNIGHELVEVCKDSLLELQKHRNINIS